MGEIRTEKARSIPALVTALLGVLWLGVFPLACDFTYEHITEAKWVAMWIGIALTVPAAAFGLGGQRARGRAGLACCIRHFFAGRTGRQKKHKCQKKSNQRYQ